MKRVRPPSMGIIAVVVTYVGLAVFLGWGLSTPPLDRVWTLHHLLKIGQLERLDHKDKELLQGAMAQHPQLASALLKGQDIGLISAHLDGWPETPCATVLRTGTSSQIDRLEFEIQTPEDLLPIDIRITGNHWSEQLTATSHGSLSMSLPQIDGNPEIIEVCLSQEGAAADPSALGARITFGATQ